MLLDVTNLPFYKTKCSHFSQICVRIGITFVLHKEQNLNQCEANCFVRKTRQKSNSQNATTSFLALLFPITIKFMLKESFLRRKENINKMKSKRKKVFFIERHSSKMCNSV